MPRIEVSVDGGRISSLGSQGSMTVIHDKDDPLFRYLSPRARERLTR